MCNVALKTPLYFYRMMEKRIGYYFQVQSPYYQVTNCNKKIPIPVLSRRQVRSEKTKKAKHQHG